ncbi:MAG: threonine/serine exporter family protein [Planctomycetes bacterium]|nr:threonine/serine exporter family protein [Planctomycetota bacterium]
MTAQQFVLELGRAMHALGSPAYRVEDTMDACCRALGLEGSFFATPTAIFSAIGPAGSSPNAVLTRVPPDDHDLGRLADLYAIRDRVVRGESSPAQGLDAVRRVLDSGVGVPRWSDLMAHAAAGGGAAVLFGGGWREAAVAAFAGAAVAGIAIAASRRPRLGDVQASLACAVVAFLVSGAAALWPPVHAPIATVAAIVVLLPGLSFTTALAELAMRHLAAGSARLLGTLAVLLTMAIGIGIGDRCAALVFGVAPVAAPERLGLGWLLLGIAASWVGFVVLLRATRRQAPWVLLAMATGFGGARAGSGLFGGELGASIGAFAVTALANLHARWRRQPAAVVRTPGLLLLVPGSLGLSGLTTALTGDFASSAPFAFRMLLVGGAIVAGLLFAGVLVPPPLDVEPEAKRRPLVRGLLRPPPSP